MMINSVEIVKDLRNKKKVIFYFTANTFRTYIFFENLVSTETLDKTRMPYIVSYPRAVDKTNQLKNFHSRTFNSVDVPPQSDVKVSTYQNILSGNSKEKFT